MVLLRKLTGIILVIIFLSEQVFAAGGQPCIAETMDASCLAPSSEMEAITVKKMFLNTLIEAWVDSSRSRGPEEAMDWKKIHYHLLKNGFDIREISGSSEKDSYVTLFFRTVTGGTQAVSFHFDRKGKNLIKPKISFPPDQEAYAFGLDQSVETMDNRILKYLETPAFDKSLWAAQHEKEKEAQKENGKNKDSKRPETIVKSVLAYGATAALLTGFVIYAPLGLYTLGSALLIALLTGLITMAETALISTTRDEKAVAYLRKLAEKGNPSAEKALSLVNKTYQKLPTITLTKNFVGVPGGIMISNVSNAFISRYISSGLAASVLDRVFSVVISLIFSEQIPKDIASSQKKIYVVMAMAPVFPFFEKVLWPFIALLNRLNHLSIRFVSALFFLDRASRKKEGLYARKFGKIFENGWLEGTLSDVEYHFLHGVLSLESATVGDVLEKRDWSYTLFSLPPEMKITEAAKNIDQNFFSLIPVIDQYGVCHQVVSREAILLHVQKMKNLQREMDSCAKRQKVLKARLEAAESVLKTSKEPDKTERLIALYKKHIRIAEETSLSLAHQLSFLEFKNLMSLEDVPHLLISRDQAAKEVLKLFFSDNPIRMGIVVDPRNKRPVGVVTLEDMMEYLFQQEIFDETDLVRKSRGSLSSGDMDEIFTSVSRKNKRLSATLAELKKENLASAAPNHVYEIPRLEKELGFLTSVQIGFLFDLLWSDAFGDRKMQPFIYSSNMEGYHSLVKWFQGKKEYAELFGQLKKSFKVIRRLNSNVPASHNYHQIYNDFYRLIRYSQIGNPQRDTRIDLLLKDPVLQKMEVFLMKRNERFLKDNLIRLKEMSQIVEGAQSYRPLSLFRKIQPFLTAGMIMLLFGGVLAGAFLISAQMGSFVLITLSLTFLSGMISGMEAAIFSVNREAVENLSYTGDRLALILKGILENRQKYIPTTVFFDTLIKIPGGILLKSASLPILGELGSWLFSTIWFTIFVKVIPKFLGVNFSLPVAKTAAPVLKFLRGLFYPVVFLMQKLTLFFKAFLKALSFGKIDFMEEPSAEKGVEIYNQQRQEINRVFEAEKQNVMASRTDEGDMPGERQETIRLLEKGLSFFGEVPQVLTVGDILGIKEQDLTGVSSSSRIFDLPSDMTIEEANGIVQNCPYSRILLYDRLVTGKINYIGCVFKKDILQAYMENDRKDSPLSSLVYTLVPRTGLSSPAKDSLKKFLAVGTAHLSLVEDSKGNPVAVLSLEDIMRYMLTLKDTERQEKKSLLPPELAEMISSWHPEKQAA